MMIWHYVLGTMRIYPAYKGTANKYVENGSNTTSAFNADRQLGLIRTCRQLYSEAGLVFFRENTFSFDDYNAIDCFGDTLGMPNSVPCRISVSRLRSFEMYIESYVCVGVIAISEVLSLWFQTKHGNVCFNMFRRYFGICECWRYRDA